MHDAFKYYACPHISIIILTLTTLWCLIRFYYFSFPLDLCHPSSSQVLSSKSSFAIKDIAIIRVLLQVVEGEINVESIRAIDHRQQCFNIEFFIKSHYPYIHCK